MKTIKLVIGIVSINLFCICFLQSSLLSLATSLVNVDMGSAAGQYLSFCMLTGGILAISTRDGRSGGYVSAGFYLAGTVIGLFQKEAYKDFWVWVSVCFIFGLVMLIFTFIVNRSADQEETIEDELTPTELLKLQKLLFKDKDLDFIMSEEGLYQMAQEKISGNMGVIHNAKVLIESTTDIETFFTQSKCIPDLYKEMYQFAVFFPFDESPADLYSKFIAEQSDKTKKFIARYFQHLKDSSADLPVEQKQCLYEKEYETFKKFYPMIDHEAQGRIETEFQKMLIE